MLEKNQTWKDLFNTRIVCCSFLHRPNCSRSSSAVGVFEKFLDIEAPMPPGDGLAALLDRSGVKKLSSCCGLPSQLACEGSIVVAGMCEPSSGRWDGSRIVVAVLNIPGITAVVRAMLLFSCRYVEVQRIFHPLRHASKSGRSSPSGSKYQFPIDSLVLSLESNTFRLTNATRIQEWVGGFTNSTALTLKSSGM